MSKEQQINLKIDESIVGFYFIQKSANNLVDDLKNFSSEIRSYNDEQIYQILGSIEEIEEKIKEVRVEICGR